MSAYVYGGPDGRKFKSGEAYDYGNGFKYRYDFDDGVIITTYLENNIKAYRTVLSGKFSYSNGIPAGVINRVTDFSHVVSGAAKGDEDGWSLNLPNIQWKDYPAFGAQENATTANYFYSSDGYVYKGGKFSGLSTITDRSQLSGLPDIQYAKNGWWDNPFEFTLSIESSSANSTYALTTSSTSINEGDTLTTTIKTTGVAKDTIVYWKVSGTGITAKDLSSGALKGTLTVGVDGRSAISHTLKADSTTEGDESLTIQVFSDKKMKKLVGESEIVNIADTSKKAVKGGGSGGGNANGQPPATTADKEIDTVTGFAIQEGRMLNPYSTNNDSNDTDPFGRIVSDRISNARYTPGPEAKGEDSFILYQDLNNDKVLDSGDKQFGAGIASDNALYYWSRDLDTPIISGAQERSFEIVITGKAAFGKGYTNGFHTYDLIISDTSAFRGL